MQFKLEIKQIIAAVTTTPQYFTPISYNGKKKKKRERERENA